YVCSCLSCFSCSTLSRPPQSTRFPYTTLFRSGGGVVEELAALGLPARQVQGGPQGVPPGGGDDGVHLRVDGAAQLVPLAAGHLQDRKSTRLNSSHVSISYAVFCLKKKKTQSV